MSTLTELRKRLKLKNRIKELRTQKGLTQTELAELAFTNQNTISAIESDKYAPTAYTAGLICQALGCKFEDCFYFATADDKKEQ